MKNNSLLWLFLLLPGTALAQEVNADLDLPIVPPVYGTEKKNLPPTPPKEVPASEWPAPTLFGEELVPENGKIIFVIDRSASMWDDNAGNVTYQPAPENPGDPLPPLIKNGKRIDKAKAELVRLIRSLPPHFKFDVVEFTDNNATILWPHAGGDDEGMREATDSNKVAAIQWIKGLTYGGNTPTYQGVAMALDFLRNFHIVLLTDGFPWAWSPISNYWADPRVPGYVPNLHGEGNTSMNASSTPAPENSPIWSSTLENEWLIDYHNHVIRTAKGSRPARIDVFGIEAHSGQYKWFCETCAFHNGGTFTLVN